MNKKKIFMKNNTRDCWTDLLQHNTNRQIQIVVNKCWNFLLCIHFSADWVVFVVQCFCLVDKMYMNPHIHKYLVYMNTRLLKRVFFLFQYVVKLRNLLTAAVRILFLFPFFFFLYHREYIIVYLRVCFFSLLHFINDVF